MSALLARSREASPRGRRARRVRRILAAALAAIACAPAFAQTGARPPRASVSDTPAPGVLRVAQQPQQYEGHPVSLIFFDLYGGTDSVGRDRDLRRRIEQLASPIGSGRFSVLLADRALAEIRSLPGVRDASYAI